MPTSPSFGQTSDHDLKLLRIFKAVADCGGLSAAENELNIGRSTISKYVADLEHRLKLTLCERGPSGFALTDDGVRVLAAGDRLMIAASEFQSEVAEIREKLSGTIRIALFDMCGTNPEAKLAKSIRSFNAAAPQIEIDLSLEPPNVIEAKVITGHLDIGIIAHHRPSPSLAYHPLYGENMMLYCGVGHPFFDRDPDNVTLEDVRAVDYAGISVNSPNLLIGQSFGLKRSAKVQSEHALSILILSGSYIGFLPDHMAQTYVSRELVRTVLPDQMTYRVTFSAAVRRNPAPNRVTSIFLKHLTQTHA